jgi:hypothetical protein
MASGATKLAVACAVLLAVGTGYAQDPGTQKPRKWVDSFSAYKSHIRPLSPTAANACETQLRRILEAIDKNQACAVDSECTLVSEEPFGQTVPVQVAGASALSSDMKQFRASCNNESMRSFYNSELVHAAACVQNRCMVKTSVKR